MDRNKLAREVTLMEGGKISLSEAQVKETIRKLFLWLKPKIQTRDGAADLLATIDKQR